MQTTRSAHGLFVGGIRTFPLVALAGGVAALLARSFGSWIVGVALGALCLMVAIAYYDDVRNNRDRGMTSEVAFVVTFLLGALGLSPEVLPESRLLIVAGAGVAVMGLLSMKEALHGWAAKISKDDLYATVKFLVVAVIVLPLLPDKTWDPLQALNPRKIGLMITLIAGIGFAGYLAFRILGAGRGMTLTGLLGGVVSSTAVTLSLSGRAKEHPSLAPACAAGVVLAWTVMFVRLLVVVGIVHQGLAKVLAIPLLAAALAGGVGVLFFYRRLRQASAGGEDIKLSNPFKLWSAVKFGALFAAVLVLSKLAVKAFGGAGLVAMGAVAGSTDVDAVALSAARMVGDDLHLKTAALAILVACASNTIVKGAMAWVLGGAEFGKRLLPLAGAMFVLGGVGAFVAWKLINIPP
jgi:uncharacterized membrane protein (DUF4010 family)